MLSSSGSSLNGANVYGEQLAGAKPPSRRQPLAGHLHIDATGGPGDAPGQDYAGGPAVEEPGHRSFLPGGSMIYVHPRMVSSQTLLAEGCLPIRTFQCGGVGRHAGRMTATGWPATACCGAQGIIDSTADDLHRWQPQREMPEAETVADAVRAGDGAFDLCVETAMDDVGAHIDGRWQSPKVATMLVRRLESPAEAPILGAVLARRSVSALGSAEDLAAHFQQVIREVGWECFPIEEVVGNVASWMWKVATAYFPGVWQTLDDAHLMDHLYAFAHILYPNNRLDAKAWVEQKI
jgi:hypothetical protein